MTRLSSDRLIRIAIAVSAEKKIDVLLDRILTEAMDITGCDGGTVYIRDGEFLHFHNMITQSKGVHMIREGQEDLLPPVPLTPTHVCARSALDHRLINIDDVYETDEFDFSGPRRYDAMNAYRTQSMLVVPMEDERGRNIGVIQLINALDRDGGVIPFDPGYENVILALGSLAAVSLNNNRLQKSVNAILHSFVTVMVDAIDARSPYNANHTKSMARYAERFIRWLDTEDRGWRFSEEEKDPFLMSVWLHDIGKLIIPLEIMDKPTRLGPLEERILARIQVAVLMERLRAYEHPEAAEDAARRAEELREAKETILQANAAGFLSDELLEKLTRIGGMDCLDGDGARIPLLRPEELEAITVRKGTLTDGERAEIERHVVYTARLLGNMKFEGDYEPVPGWASAHHEFLNGTGYPRHITGDQLPKPVRLLTILDVYDALTAEDRPYKPAMPPERAFQVLESMRDEGKLDGEILSLFRESGAWKR